MEVEHPNIRNLLVDTYDCAPDITIDAFLSHAGRVGGKKGGKKGGDTKKAAAARKQAGKATASDLRMLGAMSRGGKAKGLGRIRCGCGGMRPAPTDKGQGKGRNCLRVFQGECHMHGLKRI